MHKHWKHFLWGFLAGFFFLQGLNFWQDLGAASWQAWVSLVAAAAFYGQMYLSLKRGE